MRNRIIVSSLLAIGSSLSACAANSPSRAVPFPTQDPRYAELARCAQAIGVAEGFQVSTSSQTLLERSVGDMRQEVKELLWLNMVPDGDVMRASAHVQLTSDSRRTTTSQLSSVGLRAVQRINSECTAPRAEGTR